MVALPAELVDPFLALFGRVGGVRGKRKIGRTPLPCMTRRAAELFRRMRTVRPHEQLQTRMRAVLGDLSVRELHGDDVVGKVARIEAKAFHGLGTFVEQAGARGIQVVRFFKPGMHVLGRVFRGELAQRFLGEVRAIDSKMAGGAAIVTGDVLEAVVDWVAFQRELLDLDRGSKGVHYGELAPPVAPFPCFLRRELGEAIELSGNLFQVVFRPRQRILGMFLRLLLELQLPVRLIEGKLGVRELFLECLYLLQPFLDRRIVNLPVRIVG